MVCQGVSYIFSEFFFESTYARATLTLASIRPRLPSPLGIFIIPHRVGFVKGFFKKLLKKFVCRKGRTVTAVTIQVRPNLPEPTWVGSPPLDTNILSQIA